MITLSDSLAWQKGSHQMKFGFSGFQEHDLYWNAPAGITYYDLGLAGGDPALGAFTTATLPGATTDQLAEAQSLYATLVGRISYVSGQFGLDPKTKKYQQTPGSNYNLNELLRSWGLFAQDSWRLLPGLTLKPWSPLGFHRRQSRFDRRLSQRPAQGYLWSLRRG